MKIVFYICILSLAAAAGASNIEVKISEQLKGGFVFVNYTGSAEIVNVSAEFYNTGSVAYSARLRLDLFSAGKLSSVWSSQRPMVPGKKENFFFYWHPNNQSNITARLRAYFGNEILQYNETLLQFDSRETSDSFEISNVKTFQDRIEFDLKSNESLRVVAAPIKYPSGWIFEEAVAEVGTKPAHIVLPYAASLWSQETVRIAIFSDTGEHYSEKAITLAQPSKNVIEYLLMLVFGF